MLSKLEKGDKVLVISELNEQIATVESFYNRNKIIIDGDYYDSKTGYMDISEYECFPYKIPRAVPLTKENLKYKQRKHNNNEKIRKIITQLNLFLCSDTIYCNENLDQILEIIEIIGVEK